MARRKTKQAKQAAAQKARAGKSIIRPDYRREHKPDAFAAALRAAVEGSDGKLDLQKLQALAAENEIEFKWSHLNPGQQFMNFSNVARGKLRRGERVVLN